jgi:hypothetical protein
MSHSFIQNMIAFGYESKSEEIFNHFLNLAPTPYYNFSL